MLTDDVDDVDEFVDDDVDSLRARVRSMSRELSRLRAAQIDSNDAPLFSAQTSAHVRQPNDISTKKKKKKLTQLVFSVVCSVQVECGAVFQSAANGSRCAWTDATHRCHVAYAFLRFLLHRSVSVLSLRLSICNLTGGCSVGHWSSCCNRRHPMSMDCVFQDTNDFSMFHCRCLTT
jgi:hypothetical protein